MSVISRSALESSTLADLHEIASELGLDGFRRLRKGDLVAAIGHGVDAGAQILRVHDVAAAADFLAVRAALRGELVVDPGLALREEIRHSR